MLGRLKLWLFEWLLSFTVAKRERKLGAILLAAEQDNDHRQALEIQRLAPPDKIDTMIHNALVDYKKARIKGIEVLEFKYGTLFTNLSNIRKTYVEQGVLPELKGK